MQKRVFIIHGWGGFPEEGWFPWLRRELVSRGFLVSVPPMPDSNHPNKEQWIAFLAEQVGHCDSDTYFVGHSLGCQTILRYLQGQLPPMKVGGAVFVAGFETLTSRLDQVEDAHVVLDPWLNEDIHWEMIRSRSRNFVAIFSDNDRWVPLSNVKVFDEKLEAKTIVLHDKKHFSGDDNVTELPEVLDAILEMTT
ncbi:MAG TPA: alpha/beta fold hydrolase [Candidatus Peribacteraceae bacterium]|nr:alpha/beta fold hydrolase [Candidatus Peribacteraceae bacterium]